MDAIDLLIQFNLTRQEAAIYLALLSEDGMNGYEVAKRTGISRSNTYTSLAALVEKLDSGLPYFAHHNDFVVFLWDKDRIPIFQRYIVSALIVS